MIGVLPGLRLPSLSSNPASIDEYLLDLVKLDLCGVEQARSFRKAARILDDLTLDNIECYGTEHGSANIDQTSEGGGHCNVGDRVTYVSARCSSCAAEPES